MNADGRRRLRWMVVGGVIAASVGIAVGVGWPTADPAPTPPAPKVISTPTTWVTSGGQLTVGGIARRYVLVRPATVSAAKLPVVVVLHGRNATPEVEEQRTGFPALVGRAILVYPAGYQESWNAGACCAGAHTAGVDDVAFITDVVHRVLTSQHDADAGRVFLVGFSNGGKMAFRLTCAEPRLFQGVAVVGAVPVAACARPPAVPFAELAFDHDPLFTLTSAQPPKVVNGFPQASLEDEATALRAANGCLGNGSQQVQGTLTTTRWADCRTGKPVELGLYQGNTHIWPTGDAATPAAGQVIWTFFRSITEGHQ